MSDFLKSVWSDVGPFVQFVAVMIVIVVAFKVDD